MARKVVYPMQTANKTILLSDGTVHHNCPRCNLYLNGNYGMYAHHIIHTFGLDYYDKCVKIYNDWIHGKIKAPKVAEMRKIYNEKLAEVRHLEKSLGKLIPGTWKPEK